MPSPFPGMDPWLESTRYFGDLHDSLIYNLQEELQRLLPESYFARKSVRVWLEVPERRVGPDVYIMKGERRGTPDYFPSVATIGETGPLVVIADPPEPEEITERYLDIYQLEDGTRRLVTSIEILSPTNKGICGDGRTHYLKKQQEILASQVHLIEIDLLRGGRHTTAVPVHELERQAGGTEFDYHVCLHCFDQPNQWFIYPFKMEDPLPEIAVPLLPGDPVLTVALQPIFDRSYDAGGFAREINYPGETPDPPLTGGQQAWVQSRFA
jgi:Protein of unknown function (DUF4058)